MHILCCFDGCVRFAASQFETSPLCKQYKKDVKSTLAHTNNKRCDHDACDTHKIQSALITLVQERGAGRVCFVQEDAQWLCIAV